MSCQCDCTLSKALDCGEQVLRFKSRANGWYFTQRIKSMQRTVGTYELANQVFFLFLKSCEDVTNFRF